MGGWLGRGEATSLRTTDSPGTARCLRGMALSLDGSEPIQSALTLPIPAGRVFMSETTCQHAPSGNRSPVQTRPRWRIPVRSQQEKTPIDHLVVSPLMYPTYTTGSKRTKTRTRSSMTRFLARSPVGYCMASRCAVFQPTNRAFIDRTSGWLTTVIILLEQNSARYPPFCCFLA